MEDVKTRILEQQATLLIFIAKLNRKMDDLFHEDWGNSAEPDHLPVLTRWLYDSAIKEVFEEITKGWVK